MEGGGEAGGATAGHLLGGHVAVEGCGHRSDHTHLYAHTTAKGHTCKRGARPRLLRVVIAQAVARLRGTVQISGFATPIVIEFLPLP